VRAILLAGDSDTNALLTAAFNYVDVPLEVAGDTAALEHFARRAHAADLVVLNCGGSAAQECLHIVQHTRLHVIALCDSVAMRQRMTEAARGAVSGLPLRVPWTHLVRLLRSLKDENLVRGLQGGAKDLTVQQLRVLELVAANRSQSEIATERGVGIGTVKRHVERLKDKLDVSGTAELKLAFSWMTRPQPAASRGARARLVI